MLQKMILLGLFVGACGALPIVYEANSNLVDAVVAASTKQPETRYVQTDAGPLRTTLIAATPMAAAPAEQPLLGRKVLLKADDRGHYVADFRLNGRAVTALVDTGATTVAINRSTARRIGISLTNSDFKYPVQTANGATKAAVAVIDRIDIGRITLEDVEAAVLDDRALDGTLVGMSFLKRLSKFQTQNGDLILQQ
jgi:aspartyl protease family protein